MHQDPVPELQKPQKAAWGQANPQQRFMLVTFANKNQTIMSKWTSLEPTFLHRKTTVTRKLPPTKEEFVGNIGKRTFSAAKGRCGPERRLAPRTGAAQRPGRTRASQIPDRLELTTSYGEILTWTGSCSTVIPLRDSVYWLPSSASPLRPRQTFRSEI